MRTRILCAIQYDVTPAVTSIFSYPCPNTTSDIEFTIILTLLCIFCNKIRYKGRVEMALSLLPKKVLWFLGEDLCLSAFATKEVKSYHHCEA